VLFYLILFFDFEGKNNGEVVKKRK